MSEGEEDKNKSSSGTCPICLGPFIQESYLDHCFHKFCFNCILRWTKVVSYKLSRPPSSVKCPLCKTENYSIVHGYDGISFQRHYINQNVSNSSDFFSEAHKYRLQCYYVEPVEAENTLTDQFNVARFWKSRKYLKENRWIQSWLKREMQALLQEDDVEIIVHHVLGAIESFRSDPSPRSSPEASQEKLKAAVSKAAKPFLAGRADRFAVEVELFLASGFNIEAYDKVYLHHLGWKQNPDEEQEQVEHEPVTPLLRLFDGDPDEVD